MVTSAIADRYGPAVRVARAVSDLRMGMPVCLRHNGDHLLLAAAETLGAALFGEIRKVAGARLLLSAHRARTLSIPDYGRAEVSLPLKQVTDFATLQALADPTLDLDMPFKGPFRGDRRASRPLEQGALALAKRARLLPAALVWQADEGRFADYSKAGVLTVTADDLAAISTLQKDRLEHVASGQLPAEVAEDARLRVFRSHLTGETHLAFLVGEPENADNVLVRIHSACLTGDVLGSLKCDCGTQLREALGRIGREGCGILLYMDHEGRGIGLASKIRAYELQDQGYDTVDANRRLGFETDERTWGAALAMLEALRVRSVRLLTNNPAKVEALKDRGMKVSERVAHSFPANPHNAHYLETKRKRTGHWS